MGSGPGGFRKAEGYSLFTWQTKMEEHNAWNAVFWCNHDQPRVVSRFGDEGALWKESAKMLGTVIHCMRGTPYIYQGEEIGMTNTDFTEISQFKDVESLNYYQILQDKGLAARDALRIVQIHSRDNGRTPMQWDASRYAGFMAEDAAQEPWIGVNSNHDRINAASQTEDENSIFSHYRKLVQMRKDLDVIAYGSFEPLAEKHPSVLAYRRAYENQDLIVVNNFYGKECTWKSGLSMKGYRCVLTNYADENPASETGEWTLRPMSPWFGTGKPCKELYKEKSTGQRALFHIFADDGTVAPRWIFVFPRPFSHFLTFPLAGQAWLCYSENVIKFWICGQALSPFGSRPRVC